MDVVSMLSLLFAAVAAVGAVRTVQLTRDIAREGDERRLVEAIIAVKHAGRASEELRVRHLASPEADDRFRDAQEELERALAGRRLVIPLDALTRCAAMLAANSRHDPGEASDTADETLSIIRERRIERITHRRWYERPLARLFGDLG